MAPSEPDLLRWSRPKPAHNRSLRASVPLVRSAEPRSRFSCSRSRAPCVLGWRDQECACARELRLKHHVAGFGNVGRRRDRLFASGGWRVGLRRCTTPSALDLCDAAIHLDLRHVRDRHAMQAVIAIKKPAVVHVCEAAMHRSGAACLFDLTALGYTHRIGPTAAGQPHERYSQRQPSHRRGA